MIYIQIHMIHIAEILSQCALTKCQSDSVPANENNNNHYQNRSTQNALCYTKLDARLLYGPSLHIHTLRFIHIFLFRAHINIQYIICVDLPNIAIVFFSLAFLAFALILPHSDIVNRLTYIFMALATNMMDSNILFAENIGVISVWVVVVMEARLKMRFESVMELLIRSRTKA